MDREELVAWLRLLLTPGIGPAVQRRLLSAFGLPQQVFAAGAAALAERAGPLTTSQVRALHHAPARLDALTESTEAWLDAGVTPEGPTRRVITLADGDYPPALLEAPDPPLLLHAQGRALARGRLAWPPALAVVGSRHATPQGLANARAFSRHLAGQGWTVVSGLALGIDGAAHEGAMEGAAPKLAPADDPTTLSTVAVLGTGLDRIYPAQHGDLAQRIAQQGLLLSEFPLGTPPLPENFPRRNRIIAALARGTLVIEAAPQSGSLITARLAAELGREVFAIPGSIHAPQSRGCHALIRQGAKLVETAQDVLEELGWAAPHAPHAPARARPRPATPAKVEDVGHAATPALTQDPVLLALGWEAVGLDALLARTGQPAAWLQARLLALELAGHLSRLPGGLYQRLGCA